MKTPVLLRYVSLSERASGRCGSADDGRPTPALSSDVIELCAAEIRHVARVATLEMAIKVGEIVFRRVFRGDAELMRRNGPKDVSFGRLAQRKDIEISKANLWRSVAIYELSRRIPRLARSKHLGISHVRAVLGLPPEQQATLLARAERECLGVSALVSEARSSKKGQGGRPPKPEVFRVLDRLMRVAAVPLKTFEDPKPFEKLSGEDIECAVTMLQELEDRIQLLRSLLRDAKRRERA